MEELKRLRTERGWSQQKLADASGVNKATINQVEQGKRSPSIATLESLARAMGKEVGDFFPKVQGALFPLEDGERRASVLAWRDLLMHVGAMLQDLDGKYDPAGGNVGEMASLFFTTARAYRLANPKAGAPPEEVRYLELAEDVLKTGFRMVEARAAESEGVANLQKRRQEHKEDLRVLRGTA